MTTTVKVSRETKSKLDVIIRKKGLSSYNKCLSMMIEEYDSAKTATDASVRVIVAEEIAKSRY